jgi:hypothetical protein
MLVMVSRHLSREGGGDTADGDQFVQGNIVVDFTRDSSCTHPSTNISSGSIFVCQIRFSCNDSDVLWKTFMEQLADDMTNWIHTHRPFPGSGILSNLTLLSGIHGNRKRKKNAYIDPRHAGNVERSPPNQLTFRLLADLWL